MYYNMPAIIKSLESFSENKPFNHCVVDDFFKYEVAKSLEQEFLSYEDAKWYCYKNAIENKKALNDWNLFPPLTYKVFRDLISQVFINTLSQAVGVPLYQDPGLHGGGWHIHGPGGNLNPHYDYSIHPKIGLQRKVNIIIYLSSELKEEHGGHLGLWAHDAVSNSPAQLVKSVQPKFNRAVIFDTTQNSWHGMCQPLVQPDGIYRKSLAVYYLTDPPHDADLRERALFAPREDQKGDKTIEELIRNRADSKKYSSFYRTDND